MGLERGNMFGVQKTGIGQGSRKKGKGRVLQTGEGIGQGSRKRGKSLDLERWDRAGV